MIYLKFQLTPWLLGEIKIRYTVYGPTWDQNTCKKNQVNYDLLYVELWEKGLRKAHKTGMCTWIIGLFAILSINIRTYPTGSGSSSVPIKVQIQIDKVNLYKFIKDHRKKTTTVYL